MDNLSALERQYCMARIRSSGTAPELRVRRYLHSRGVRFRLYRRDLPGCPDIVLPRSRQVVLVHGCFWHSHECRWGKVQPRTRAEYWRTKRAGVKERDHRVAVALRHQGWHVTVIWECWTKDDLALGRHLQGVIRRATMTGTGMH